MELEAVSGTAARCVEPVEEADADDFDHDSSRRASRARAVSRERGQEELRGERKRRSAVVAEEQSGPAAVDGLSQLVLL